MLVTLAGLLAIVGALAGAYYFAMRPVTLRIAVGPANSDDVKLVQALTQAFTHAHGQVRLRPVQTDGATASAKALADGKVDLAIIRGDLDVPKNAQAVATLRKNVAVLWVPPPARGKGKKTGPKITKISQLAGRRVGVVGRTQANVNLLKVILQQYGVDPGKVEIVQFPAPRSRGSHPQSEGGCLSRRRTRQQQDHRRCDRGIDQGWRHADVPRHRFERRRSRRTIRSTRPPRFRPARSAARPTGRRMR